MASEDDCPLCLEPLPPFWKMNHRVIFTCCGKAICRDCNEKKYEHLDKAAAEGTIGREEEQLDSCCHFCRMRLPADDESTAKQMVLKFQKGELPLQLYHNLGMAYVRGTGVATNVAKGNEILMRGAEKGCPKCQYSIGTAHEAGEEGFAKSSEDAKKWYLAAGEHGHAVAEYSLALMLKDEGNDAEYLRYLKGSASKGHAVAEYSLALMMKDEGNDAECLRYLQGSASKGYDGACFSLGLAHFRGECGLRESTEEAIRVLTPNAERGHTKSMLVLGMAMCQSYSQLPIKAPPFNPNFTKGMHWLRRAVEKGNEQATTVLGGLEKWASSQCFMCHKKAQSEKAFLRCSRCRAAWYCSKDCQRRHWKAKGGEHKQFCINWD